jgi:hypothetical protein
MAKIVLINFTEPLLTRLIAVLRIERHEVLGALPGQSYARWVRRQPEGADLAILDVSCRDKFFGPALDELVVYRAQHGPRPMILCISRVYRGPQFELDIENKGARLIYV